MCFQKLFWKKVKDFPKCVYYLTDMMNYLKIQNSWRSYLRNTDSVQDRTIPISKPLRQKSFYLILIQKDFTKCLSCKIAWSVFSCWETIYCCLQHYTAESNVHFLDKLKFHLHEEADTLTVLQSIDVAKSKPFCQLYVACSDQTDVLLLLLYFYPQICNNTIFRAITREIDWLIERLMLDVYAMH